MRFTTVALLLFFSAGNIFALGEGTMKITSPEFENNKSIPSQFTCEGKDINPVLEISGIPAEAQELALIVDDPDAPWGHGSTGLFIIFP